MRYLGWLLGMVFCQQACAGEARFAFFQYEGEREERAVARAGAGEYTNPILSGYAPDPSIVRVGQDYYLVNSSFAHFPGLPIYHSRDLVHWKQIGNAVDRPSQVKLTGIGVSRGLFAPDISYHDGLFYIVNTCVDCGGNFVITARNPAGPWSDPVWFKFEGIDPSIFWNDDGKAYVLNNGAPDEKPRYNGHRALWIQELDPKTLKLVGPRSQIVNGGVDISKRPIWIEGPHLFQKDGQYYLIAAEGGTGDQHSEVVFRGPTVQGPFTPYARNPILTQRDLPADRQHPVTSAGHAKFVETQNGDWWAVFLGVRPYAADQHNIGRETFLLPVTWKDGWPVILEPGQRVPFTAKKPSLPPQPQSAIPTSGDFTYGDSFVGQRLSFAWIGIRAPAEPFHTLKNGALWLNTGAPLGDVNATPAFIGRRQQHHIASVMTELVFTPDHDGERAGLAAIAADNAHLFFGVAQEAGQKVVSLAVNGKVVKTAPIHLPANAPVYLKLSFRGGRGEAFYSLRLAEWSPLKTDIDATFLDTHRSGGFVGTVIGVFHSR